MRTHVDWVTFTLTPRYGAVTGDKIDLHEEYALALQGAFVAQFGKKVTATLFGGDWSKGEKSRAPYTDSWTIADHGITLFASPSLSHCCVEVSGQGCERLIQLGKMEYLLQKVKDRVTRIDIACDIETKTKPTEFVAVKTGKRMLSSGHQKSVSGETCYVGSQKSDRYARVYRYNKPHPRAHLLRIEHVFRKEYAKSVAAQVARGNLDGVATAAGDAFGWNHADWVTVQDSGADISIVAGERNAGKTVYWLVNSVAPAFNKLCENGTILDREEFVRKYFLCYDKDA